MIASLRELLDNSKRHQSTSSDQEMFVQLEKQLAETQPLLEIEESENASLQDQQGRSGLEDFPVEPERESTEINAELVRAMLEQERQKIEAENSRREISVNATLEGLKEAEGERRHMLMEELERKDAELYESQKKIRELEERLFVSSYTQPAPQLPSPFITSTPPQPSTQQSPLILPTSPAAEPGPWFPRSRFPIPRRFHKFILIPLFFLVPNLLVYLLFLVGRKMSSVSITEREEADRKWFASHRGFPS